MCLYPQQEEDRYKLMLNKSDSENIASNYFRSKRTSQILNSDSMKSLGKCAFLLGLTVGLPYYDYSFCSQSGIPPNLERGRRERRSPQV